MNFIQIEVFIDERLRFLLFGLEVTLGISLNAFEFERVFEDSVTDQVSTKHYSLYSSPGLLISADVEEYEPDSVWLKIEGIPGLEERLSELCDNAARHARFLRQSRDHSSG